MNNLVNENFFFLCLSVFGCSQSDMNIDEDGSIVSSNSIKRAKVGNQGQGALKVRGNCPAPAPPSRRKTSTPSPMGTQKPDHCLQQLCEKAVQAVLLHGYSFRWIENEDNCAILSFLNNAVKPIPAATLQAELLKLHQKTKEEVKCDLHKVSSRICLAADFWTSCTDRDYLCLSAHYVNDNWELNSKILNFSVAPFPNFANDLCDRIYAILKEWAIENKLFSLTIHNACTMGDMQEMLCEQLKQRDALLCQGKYFKIESCAHIFDLTIQDSLKVIDDTVNKIRESVKYVSRSEPVFHRCIKTLGLEDSEGLWLDVPNRWNSTYLMLERALYYQKAFSVLNIVDTDYCYCPTAAEWTMIEQTHKFLKPFYEMTNLFSGVDYPASDICFQKMWSIRLSIDRGVQSKENYIHEMAKKLKENFDKYWNDHSSLISFAVILDPRLKLRYVKYCLKVLGESYAEKWVPVYDQLKMLFKEYEIKHPGQVRSGDGVQIDLDENYMVSITFSYSPLNALIVVSWVFSNLKPLIQLQISALIFFFFLCHPRNFCAFTRIQVSQS